MYRDDKQKHSTYERGWRINMPTISVILTVLRESSLLAETIQTLCMQSFENCEVLCIVDPSHSEAVELLRQTAETDRRFAVIQQQDLTCSRAQVTGFHQASGEYILFSGSGDVFAPDFLEQLYVTLTQNDADIALCNYSVRNRAGKPIVQQAVHTNWLPAGATSFCYRDCPDYILRVAEPVLWNRLFKKTFLSRLQEMMGPVLSEDQRCLGAVSVAAAEKVAFLQKDLMQTGGSPKETFGDIETSVSKTVEFLRALPYSSSIENAITSFPVNHYIRTLAREVKDFSSAGAAAFYRMVHDTFNREEYAAVSPTTLRNPHQYREFLTVKKHDYETMHSLIRKRLIVSLTTYPKRIQAVVQVVEMLLAQTRKADEIILWLAEEQFPEKEKELPDALVKLAAEKRLSIRWCDDLKAHKKYFYAFQEFAEDIVVTVDDDLKYSPQMLATLYRSYLLYPEAVSAMRAHLMLISPENEIFPYHSWIQETDACMHMPSMQLVATGGAGTLYPPKLFRKEFLDKAAIAECCPLADDLWLKAMQVASEIPVVVACQYEPLSYLPGTQEEMLYQLNGRQNQNDVQLSEIIQWMDGKFGKDSFIRNLTNPDLGETILGLAAVSSHVNRERQQSRRKASSLEKQLQQAGENYALLAGEKKQTEAALMQKQREVDQQKANAEALQKEKQRLTAEKENLNMSLKQTEVALKRMEQKYLDAEAGKPIQVQLKALGNRLHQQKQQKHSPGLGIKFAVYYLAWIPEKILAAMMYYLQNGAKQTLKQIYRKLFRRGQ